MLRKSAVVIFVFVCVITRAGLAMDRTDATTDDQPCIDRPGLTGADSRGFWALASGVYLSGAGDWLTTREFRQQGVEEANPAIGAMADDPVALAAVKLGGGTLVNYASYRLRREGRRFWAVPQIVWIALNVAASLHNANVAD